MNTILRYITFAIFCGLFLIHSVAAQIDKGSPAPTPKPKPSISTKPTPTPSSKELKIEFPDVEGWEKSSVQRFPTADLGYSVTYESPAGGRVTVYVYNGGVKNIPDGIASPGVKDQLERAKSEIHQMGKAGYYENVQELIDDTITLGGTSGKVKALRSLFTFSAQGQDRDSDIYLFGYQNNFIKIRATRPKNTSKTPNKALAQLFSEIDTLFSK